MHQNNALEEKLNTVQLFACMQFSAATTGAKHAPMRNTRGGSRVQLKTTAEPAFDNNRSKTQVNAKQPVRNVPLQLKRRRQMLQRLTRGARRPELLFFLRARTTPSFRVPFRPNPIAARSAPHTRTHRDRNARHVGIRRTASRPARAVMQAPDD